jgi:F-type H+-transporting ATPase subunit delta
LLCKSNSRLSKLKGVAEAVDTDMKSIVLTISSNEELSTFIQNQQLELKKKALLKFFTLMELLGLFHLLFENKRFEILDAIATDM